MARREPDTFFLLFFSPLLCIFLWLSGLRVVVGYTAPRSNYRVRECDVAPSLPVITHAHEKKVLKREK